MGNIEPRGRHERFSAQYTQNIGQIALFELSEWEQLQSIILRAKVEFDALPKAEQRELERQRKQAQDEADYILAQ